MTTNFSNFCMNLSSSGVTEEYWTLEDRFIVNGQVTAAFMLLYITVGLHWKFLVVITVIKEKLYYQPTILFLLNLAIIDILQLLLVLPTITVTGVAGEYIIGSSDLVRCQICSVVGIFPQLLLLDSIFLIALMSIDRFLFIYKPLQYERKATTKIVVLAMIAAAMLSIILGVFPVATPQAFQFVQYFLICTFSPAIENWYTSLPMIIVVLIAVIVIMVCDIWVIHIVQKNIKQIYFMKRVSHSGKSISNKFLTSDRNRKEGHKKQFHLFYVFGTLLLSDVITWVPLLIFGTVNVFADIPFNYFSLPIIIVGSQTVVHPIIVSTLISDVREPLKEMVTCGRMKKKKKKDNLAMPEEHTGGYFICCRHAKEIDYGSCRIFKLIDDALQLQLKSSNLN